MKQIKNPYIWTLFLKFYQKASHNNFSCTNSGPTLHQAAQQLFMKAEASNCVTIVDKTQLGKQQHGLHISIWKDSTMQCTCANADSCLHFLSFSFVPLLLLCRLLLTVAKTSSDYWEHMMSMQSYSN